MAPTPSRAYLELVRVFMVPSAVADSFAGLATAALLHGLPLRLIHLLPLAVTSILIYACGMAANDLFDAKEDRREAPHRPIPSGRISRLSGMVVAALLAGGALALGVSLGIGVPVAALLVLVLLYDAGGKRLPLTGSLLMGLCRWGNFLLGPCLLLGIEDTFGASHLLWGSLILCLYVTSVTFVSTFETASVEPHTLRLRLLPVVIVPWLLLILRRDDPFLWIHLAVVGVLLRGALRAAVQEAGKDDTRSNAVARFVGRALGGIPLVDAAIVLALSPPGAQRTLTVGALYLLFFVAQAWRRSWVRRGGESS